MNLLVFVCSCKKYAWKVEKQQEWLGNMRLPYLIFSGDPAQDREYRYWPPFLSVRHADYYEKMPGKLIKAMSFVVDWEFDYVLKVDDDAFLHTQEIDRIELSSDYAGVVHEGASISRTWHYGKVHDPALDNVPYKKEVKYNYCGGGIGYFLSRRAFDVFLGHADPAEADSWIFEDIYVGEVLGRNGIAATQFDMKRLTIREWVPVQQ
jgi:hypothetical protein